MIEVGEKIVKNEVRLVVDESFDMPKLSDLVPAGGTLASVGEQLDCRYFDTTQRELAKANVTLFQCVGECAQPGWLLKLPLADAGAELCFPPSDGVAIPKALRDLTVGLRRGHAARQVARLRIERTSVQLVDVGGELLVELNDDRVHATTLGMKTVVSTWREVEVRHHAGDRRLPRRIVKRIVSAGASPAGTSSRLEHASATSQVGPPAQNGWPADESCVGALVLDYLGEQRQALIRGDVELRRGSDAIHATRVAVRRFRSTLRTFHSVLDVERAAALEAELRWYAGLLGAVRDPEVMGKHLREVVAGLPVAVVLGPVTSRIEQHLIRQREEHRRVLLRALNGRRYFALLDEIDRWIAEPPFTTAAGAAQKHAGRLAERAQKKLEGRLQLAASSAEDPAGLHRARKSAKRARYAWELAAPVIPANTATRHIKKLKAIQDTLGEFQDSVVAADTLLHLGIRADASPNENGFSFGLLFAGEQRRAENALRKIFAKLV